MSEVSDGQLQTLADSLRNADIRVFGCRQPKAHSFRRSLTVFCHKLDGEGAHQESTLEEIQATLDALIADLLGWPRGTVAERRLIWDYSGPLPS